MPLKGWENAVVGLVCADFILQRLVDVHQVQFSSNKGPGRLHGRGTRHVAYCPAVA